MSAFSDTPISPGKENTLDASSAAPFSPGLMRQPLGDITNQIHQLFAQHAHGHMSANASARIQAEIPFSHFKAHRPPQASATLANETAKCLNSNTLGELALFEDLTTPPGLSFTPEELQGMDSAISQAVTHMEQISQKNQRESLLTIKKNTCTNEEEKAVENEIQQLFTQVERHISQIENILTNAPKKLRPYIIIELLHKCSDTFKINEIAYETLLTTIKNMYPSLHEYCSKAMIVGPNHSILQMTTLNFAGITVVVDYLKAALGANTLHACPTLAKFIALLQEVNKKPVAQCSVTLNIYDPEHLTHLEGVGKHFLSIFVNKNAQQLEVFINDSLGIRFENDTQSTQEHEWIRQLVLLINQKEKTAEVSVLEGERQNDPISCAVFAVLDSYRMAQNPDQFLTVARESTREAPPTQRMAKAKYKLFSKLPEIMMKGCQSLNKIHAYLKSSGLVSKFTHLFRHVKVVQVFVEEENGTNSIQIKERNLYINNRFRFFMKIVVAKALFHGST